MANLSDIAQSMHTVLKDSSLVIAEYSTASLGRIILSKILIIVFWINSYDYNRPPWVMMTIAACTEVFYKATYVFGPEEEIMKEFWLWAAWRCLWQCMGGRWLMKFESLVTTEAQKDKQWNIIWLHLMAAGMYLSIWFFTQGPFGITIPVIKV